MATVKELDTRLTTLERRDIVSEELHKHLEQSDAMLTSTVGVLSDAINNPKTGLIVELRELRRDLKQDRKVVLAAVGIILGTITTITSVFAPAIRTLLHIGS